MKYNYVSLYNKSAAFYRSRPMAKWALKLSNIFLTCLFLLSYGVLWVYAVWVELLNPKELLGILYVPMLALFIVSVLRLAIDKPRPYAENGAGIEPLITKKKADDKSFPSRHLACATVISMTFLPFYPIAGAFLLAASALLGYVRFAAGLHYPSDLFAGAGIGIVIGCLIFIL